MIVEVGSTNREGKRRANGKQMRKKGTRYKGHGLLQLPSLL